MTDQSPDIVTAGSFFKIGCERGIDDAQSDDLLVAKESYRLRRVRARKFGADAYIFSDPAWDILLIIFIADSSGMKISRSVAAMAGENPESTGLRILKDLEKRGLVQSEKDLVDKRRIFVSLTERASALMRVSLQG